MAQKLFIPHIGSVVVLTDDWTFDLFFVYDSYPLIQTLYAGPEFVAPKPTADEISWHKRSPGRWVSYKKKSYAVRPEDWHTDSRYRVLKALPEDELKLLNHTEKHFRRMDRPYIVATLPAGTPLRVDRVNIKSSLGMYSSMKFGITKECLNKKLRGKRFSVYVRDVNKIFCEPI